MDATGLQLEHIVAAAQPVRPIPIEQPSPGLQVAVGDQPSFEAWFAQPEIPRQVPCSEAAFSQGEPAPRCSAIISCAEPLASAQCELYVRQTCCRELPSSAPRRHGDSYGRSIAEWKELIRASPLTKPGELVGWLKAEYGLGHGHANALVADTLAERK